MGLTPSENARSSLAFESLRRPAAGAGNQLFVGFRQRLAGIAKLVGDGIAAVAAEILLGDLDAPGGLAPLVLGDVEQAIDPRHHLAIETRSHHRCQWLLTLDPAVPDRVQPVAPRQRNLSCLGFS